VPYVGEARPDTATLLRDILSHVAGVNLGGVSHNLLSSVTHGTGHGLIRLLVSVGEDAEGTVTAQVRLHSGIVAAHLAPALMVHLQAGLRAHEMLGWPDDEHRDEAQDALDVWAVHVATAAGGTVASSAPA